MNEARPCTECGHPFASHNRHLKDASTMEVDAALLSKKSGNIYSGGPVGESACSVCSCRSYCSEPRPYSKFFQGQERR